MSITHCTSKKTDKAEIVLSGNKSTQDTVFDNWNEKINSCTPIIAAKKLYCSRGFKTLLNHTDADTKFFIVSAGLGLLEQQTLVPSYDCTIASGHSSSLGKICIEKPNLPKWWKNICNTRYSVAGITEESREADILLVSLTKKYLDMVIEDIQNVNIPTIIFSTEKNHPNQLPDNFLRAPYTIAFDGPMGKLRGTMGDLSQRYHADFLRRLKLNNGDYKKTLSSLKRDMLSWPLPEKGPPRTAKTDQQIAIIIEKHLKAFTNKRDFLKYLRYTLNISCEEKRFNKLYISVKEQKLCQPN